MLVLAELGAGPFYNAAVLDQALNDLTVGRLLYVIDGFAFGHADWNETRIADRTLLRKTPLRLSTMRLMARLALEEGVDPRGFLDYLTGFSKLNPVDRFPQEEWRGVLDFDRQFRPSQHAVQARIDYLYPDGAPDPGTVGHYLDALDALIDRVRAAGVTIVILKPPVPDVLRQGLLGEASFDRALRDRLTARNVPYHDLSASLPDPGLYFDPDHLNRAGVDAFYRDHLRALLAAE